MADLFITEYADAVPAGLGQFLPLGVEPALAEQKVAIGAETDSAALNVKTRFVRIHAEAACCIAVGVAPTATVDAHRLPAGAVEYFGVTPTNENGIALKISVIQDA